MADRDPRVDPRPGDITRGTFGDEFECTFREGSLVCVRMREPGQAWNVSVAMPLYAWQMTAEHDEVVHVESGGDDGR